MHVSKATMAFFDEVGIVTTDWPPESPDLNCIELVWHQMKTYLRKTVKPRNKQELEDGIRVFWKTFMTPQLCRKYVCHVSTILPIVLAQNGGPTHK